MIYPKDAITVTETIINIGQVVAVADYPNTILGVHIQQSGIQSETIVYCGLENGIPLAHNYAKDYSLSLMNYVCYDSILFDKTGAGDKAFISMTYVPYDIHKNDNSSTTPYFVNGFSYGEILISIFVFLIFMMVGWKLFWDSIFYKKETIRYKE